MPGRVRPTSSLLSEAAKPVVTRCQGFTFECPPYYVMGATEVQIVPWPDVPGEYDAVFVFTCQPQVSLSISPQTPRTRSRSDSFVRWTCGSLPIASASRG